MEWVLFFIAVIILIAVMFMNGISRERKAYRAYCDSLREDFGKVPALDYSETDMDRIAEYHNKMLELNRVSGFALDDITWNDLDMGQIFMQMNVTQSSIGEEYLYHVLRCPYLQKEGLEKWDSLVDFFSENETGRVEVQKLLHKFGKIQKFSLTKIIYTMMELQKESNLIHIILDVLLAASFCMIFVLPGPGVLFFITMLAVSIITYFRRKNEVSPYFTTFLYILNMLRAAEAINKLQYDVLLEEQERLHAVQKAFDGFEKNTYVLSTSTHTTDNPVELLLDYIRMLFHADIIKFNSMLQTVQNHINEIEELREILGRLDAAAAAASFKKSLAYACRPQFVKKELSKRAVLEINEAFHPLVEKPVANSIHAKDGVLITGSNASGKSTFLKTIAICAILAQTIGIVPAKSYRGPLFRIYSSMALKDNIRTKESYYIVEIKSLKRIVDASAIENPLLCLIDEVLRGTNTVERIAASSQILKGLLKPYVLCFAATHDIELTHILETCYTNYHFDEEVLENDIIFSYHLHKGRAETRNAIKLLSIIGYEPDMIEKAENAAGYFLKTGSWEAIS